MQYDVLILK